MLELERARDTAPSPVADGITVQKRRMFASSMSTVPVSPVTAAAPAVSTVPVRATVSLLNVYLASLVASDMYCLHAFVRVVCWQHICVACCLFWPRLLTYSALCMAAVALRQQAVAV